MDLDGPVGRLEALVDAPDSSPRGAAVLCHAHPLHGGQMHYKLLYRVAKAMEQAEIAVLRFNFRGVGRSAGHHDEGRGEQDDVRAARFAVERLYPDCPVILGGFSFGSVMASRVAIEDPGVSSLLMLGYPLDRVADPSYLERASGAGIEKLFVLGDRDPYCSVSSMRAWLERLSPPRRLEVISDADHFFTGRLPQVATTITDWVNLRPGDELAGP